MLTASKQLSQTSKLSFLLELLDNAFSSKVSSISPFGGPASILSPDELKSTRRLLVVCTWLLRWGPWSKCDLVKCTCAMLDCSDSHAIQIPYPILEHISKIFYHRLRLESGIFVGSRVRQFRWTWKLHDAANNLALLLIVLSFFFKKCKKTFVEVQRHPRECILVGYGRHICDRIVKQYGGQGDSSFHRNVVW